MLQEVHGGVEDFLVNFPKVCADFEVVAMAGKNDGTAGVAILIRKRRFEGFQWKKEVFGKEDEKGRIILAEGTGPQGQKAKLWDVHNHGLSKETVEQVINKCWWTVRSTTWMREC